MKKKVIVTVLIIGVIIMIYDIAGNLLNNAYRKDGNPAGTAYDISGDIVFDDLPIPSGNLNASEEIALPDIHNNGHGWTCTGLAYDAANDQFLVGDIGKALPSSSGFASQIVKISPDFETVNGIIDLHSTFTSMQDVQGITIDSDGSIWFCSPSENKIRHISNTGANIGSISVTSPAGIAYAHADDSFWVLTYNNKILHINKSGTVLNTYDFGYSDALDQCFLDEAKGLLYITAGANYSSRNNIYCFNINTEEQSIACTVDSYSVEGLWIGADSMVIVNDGYYHSAYVPKNQANFYTLE